MVTARLSALSGLVAAGGFAIAMTAAPIVTTLTLPVAGAQPCPAGQSSDTLTGLCEPGPGANPPAVTMAPNQLPQINGIPCTGANTGECIGLAQEPGLQGPQVQPHSTVGGSPTITGSIG